MIHFQSTTATVFHSVLYKTTSTLIETPDLTLLVDPNWLPGEIDEIRLRLRQGNPVKPLYMLFTHSHFDHILGYRAFPNSVTIGSTDFENLPEKEKVLEKIEEFDSGFYIERNYPVEYPALDIIVDQDGQQLRVGSTTLTFYLAPGHSQDGLFTIVEPMGIFIAGDYLSDAEFPFIYESPFLYLETMNKALQIIQRHKIKLLVPGHGSVTANEIEMKQRVQESVDYIITLKSFILAGRLDEAEQMINNYRFAKGLRSEHQGNIEKVKKELGRP